MTSLEKLTEANEIRVDNTKQSKRIPPFYYDSLRNGISFYFNTFRTNNASYDQYINSTLKGKKKNLHFLERQFLDEDNTVLCLINFQRFFELLIKELLRKTNSYLAVEEVNVKNNLKNTSALIARIIGKTFTPVKINRKVKTINFGAALVRFYDLINFTKDPLNKTNPLSKKFIKETTAYSFLYSQESQETLKFLLWERNRILHNGNKLPSIRLLDYIVTQKIIPIVLEIYNIKKSEFGEWWYFLETVTGIKILERLAFIKWELKNSKSNKGIDKAKYNLLSIGHLKELGRANLNMNLNVRRNLPSPNEYNYSDPIGRGKRFAGIEKNESADREIKKCLCCGEESLVIYRENFIDIFNGSNTSEIICIKCYTCDYHIRYNVGEPSSFNLTSEQYFNKKDNSTFGNKINAT